MVRARAYVLMLLMLTVFAGCSKDPDYPEDRGTGVPISFNAGVMGMQAESKVNFQQKLTTPADFASKDFRIFGVWNTPHGTTAQVFNNNQAVSNVGGDTQATWSWTYSPTRYWQFGGNYEFTAVHPSTANCLSSSSGKTLLVQYNMHEDYDLMVASGSRNVDTYEDTPGNEMSDPVELHFRHACAAGQFRFMTVTDAAADYYLKSFELKYLKAVGTLIYSSSDSDILLESNESSSWNWYPSPSQATSVFSYTDTMLGDTWVIPKLDSWDDWWEGTDAHGDPLVDEKWKVWHYVIPQDMQEDPATHESPSVHFSVAVGSPTATPVHTTITLPRKYPSDYGGEHATAAQIALRNKDIVWEPGKVYVYQILVEPTSASISIVTQDWETATMAVDDVIII